MKNLILIFIISNIITPICYALDLDKYNKAQELLQLSAKGDSSVTESAFESFEQLLSDNPNSPLLLANLGSSETLLGRDAWMPWTKLSHVESGLEKIDKALELIEAEDYVDQKQTGQWQSIIVRNVAANTFEGLPFMFNRSQNAKEEIAELLKSEKLSESSQTLKNSVYSVAKRFAEQEGKSELVEKYNNLIK